MALIDSNNFVTHLVWSGLIDKATCGQLREAIELCTVKERYKYVAIKNGIDNTEGFGLLDTATQVVYTKSCTVEYLTNLCHCTIEEIEEVKNEQNANA